MDGEWRDRLSRFPVARWSIRRRIPRRVVRAILEIEAGAVLFPLTGAAS